MDQKKSVFENVVENFLHRRTEYLSRKNTSEMGWKLYLFSLTLVAIADIGKLITQPESYNLAGIVHQILIHFEKEGNFYMGAKEETKMVMKMMEENLYKDRNESQFYKFVHSMIASICTEIQLRNVFGNDLEAAKERIVKLMEIGKGLAVENEEYFTK